MTVEAQVSQYIFDVQKFISWLDLQKVCQKMSWHIWCVLQVLGDAAELHGTHKHSKYHGLCQAPPKAPQMISLQNSTQPRSGETGVTAIPDSSDFTPTFTIWHWRGRVSCNHVALPYFTFGYISGEGYNSIGSLLWRKNILMNYLIFPMVFTLRYP